ncbi:unnamed protein product [Staurois parvus]|uniref:Uncharacterized protein n=1 Tax=Staurois parvus TaxID=386267 RepID=A0ABN9AFB9_9NEOB|nr:unnamed protein product [Staurois parvus]
MGPLCPCPNSKKPMKMVPGHLMGPPTDPGPSSFQMRHQRHRVQLQVNSGPGAD